MTKAPSPAPPPPSLDLRHLAPRLRRAKLLEAFQTLAPGAALTLVIDGDPGALVRQLDGEGAGAASARYLEEGPPLWRVEVRRTVPALGASPPVAATPRPAALDAVDESRQVHVDVREDIRRGEEPLGRIMAAASALSASQVLVLRAPFEPRPLYAVLGARGFAYWTERRAPDEWVIWFYRQAGGTAPPGPEASPAGGPGPPRLDVRGLEPPEPMVRVLEALERLGPGQSLEVLHSRRPLFLYPQLDARGFEHATDEPEPGLVRIVVHRPEGA